MKPDGDKARKVKISVAEAPLHHMAGVDGFTVAKVATPTTVGAAYCQVGYDTLEPGKATRLHKHVGSEEVWYIVKGRGYIVADTERVPCKRGDFLFVPPNVPHCIVNTGKTPMVYVAIMAPPIELNGDSIPVDG